jgi:hypothetical protein
MLKKLVGFLAALVMVAIAVPAQADAQATLYIGAGGSFPTGDFGDYANTGWMGAVGALFAAGPVGVGAEFFYGQNGHKDEASFYENEKTTPYGFMGIVDYSFGESGAIQPYVFGGLGIMWHKFSADGVDSESDSGFAYQFGAGVSFPVGAKSSLFAEGRYMGSSLSEGDYSYSTNYFAALAGFAFGLGS